MKKKKKKKKNQKNVISSITENESQFSLFEVIIIILISVIFGVIIGYLLTYGNSNLSRVRSDTNLGEIVSAYNNIVDNYYDDLDEKKVAESAIKGMISSLDDPYSTFLDKNSTDTFNESVDGEYVGIGVTIEFQNEYNHIVSLLDDGPAKKAGLRVGDIIINIDGKDCKNLYSGDLSQLIDGVEGTPLNITVLRDNQELSFKVIRKKIEIENVIGKVYDENNHKIGYIKIKIFSSNSFSQFEELLTDLENKKIESLIIDLRDNPGGHLAQSKNILSMFFDKKTVLYQTESNGVRKMVYSINDDVRDYPIVLLINGETASSAEVVVACFKDNYKNVEIIGTNSYGKGNVQKSVSLSNGTSIKFTIERWLTPKGKSISEIGITPSILLEQSSKYFVDYLEEDDVQLQKAILELTKES